MTARIVKTINFYVEREYVATYTVIGDGYLDFVEKCNMMAYNLAESPKTYNYHWETK